MHEKNILSEVTTPKYTVYKKASFKGVRHLKELRNCNSRIIRVWSILFNTGVRKSAFSTESFEITSLCHIRCNRHKPCNICLITVLVSVNLFLLSLIRNNSLKHIVP